jgi:ankyrin repeat protein
VNAAADRDRAALKTLLKQGVDVNAARPDGVTALLLAAHFNDVESVDLLLGAGARVNAGDDHGVTPLAQASENANAALVERLLAAGANPNAAQTSGLTPLMIATHTGNVAVVKSLLAHGANVNAATARWALVGGGESIPISWSVHRHHADVGTVGARRHAAHVCALTGDIEVAKALIAAGATNKPQPMARTCCRSPS